MASIFSDEFSYDIFISYRHNDNKYDGWVSEFVEKLRQELDATLKDKLSVYIDQNPNDGLLETHQVNESITNKIKSVIFIPIISQTYCDTSAFAWKNEFMVFKEESENDSIGRNILLQNGNYASRILPVKIHDIEVDDLKLLEKELAGVLRSVDFIYRDAGVNRPLRPVDDELDTNRNKVLYRNQINKVANAIKEIVQGIKIGKSGTKPTTTPESITAAVPVSFETTSTSLPSSIKVQVIDRKKPCVYLAWTSSDIKEEREEMAIILRKAGFNVYPSVDCPADDEQFKELVKEEMAKCSCSLHMLSGEFGRRFEAEENVSFPQFQFLEAKKNAENTEAEFNVFVWYNQEETKDMKADQANFIKYIRNNITRHMMFSNSPGPMQLVDDIRVVMMKEESAIYDAKDTDIFFIFNQQDENDALVISELIGSEYPVETMNILPDGEDEYRLISTQQIPKSKLAVVYFKYAADWALPFIKQVWKQIGGASSPTPLLLVGEDDPATNKARNFKAPKVVSTIVSKDEVPEEVKRIYVKVITLK